MFNKSYVGVDGCFMKKNKCSIPSSTELELWETGLDRKHMLKILEDLRFETDNIIVALGLTASFPSKRWPIACYGELIDMLRRKWKEFRFVLLGDAFEHGAIITENINVVNLCGKLTLRETVALLRHVTLYIGNDTGLMHIASACDCAVVEVSSMARDGNMSYGISSNARFSPWSREAIIVQPMHQLDECVGMCQMPYAHCITQVTVEAVLEAACRLLSARGITADESI